MPCGRRTESPSGYFDTPAFVDGRVDTKFIERELLPTNS
jgi:hypothetical protein